MSIRTQTLLIVTASLVAAVFATAGVLGSSSRQAVLAETEAQGLVIARLLSRSAAFGAGVMTDVERAIGEQMVVEATIAAHLVAVAEAAGQSPAEINHRLVRIADTSVLDEIWITDETGHAYLRNVAEIDFTFGPDPEEQPQAHEFWPLLTREAASVIQEARPREADTQVFKYAGVAGVDRPRIVQVGYRAALLEELRGRMGLTRLIDQLVAEGDVVAIRILDENMITIEHAQRLAAEDLPTPAASELANVRRLVEAGGTRSYLEGRFLKVVAPLGEESGELSGGAILVTLAADRVRGALRDQTRLAAGVSAIVLLLGSVIGVAGARTISRPIAELTAMTRRIARGDLSQSIEIRSGNEIGVLAGAFNEMTRRLNESIEHLKETTAAKERIESELEIAHEIQMSMVPKIFPPFPNRSEFDVFATLAPAKEVGGDLYDFFFVDEEHLCFAVGDVSGKGVPASLFMAVTKALFKATAGSGASPDEILARLNAEICRDNDSCMFVTLFCAILNIRTGRLHYSNGGHNLPYHLRRDGAVPLQNIGGRALGLLAQSSYAAGEMVLGPGDTLVLYTDGVTEAVDTREALYSAERLARFLADNRGSTPHRLVDDLVADVRRFAGAAEQSDDITVLALRYCGTKSDMDETLEIKLDADISALADLNRALAVLAERRGLPAAAVQDFNVALEEIFTNIVCHAYVDDREHEIAVLLRASPGEIGAEVEDDGRPFNPLEAPAPALGASLQERKIGGLGIHLVRKLTDELEYERRNGRNRLVMRKTLAGR